MNQNKNCDQSSSDICQKIFRAICQIAWVGQAPNSTQSGADPPVNIRSKPEGGRRITLVLENGEGKSSTSDFPDNQVTIVAARTEPVKTLGHQGPGQSAKIAAVTLSVDQESKGSEHDMEHRFSDYINRTWVKIRSMSNVGRGKNQLPAKDSGHDEFTDHIDQSEKKLRTTSSIGGGGAGRGFSSK